MAGAVDYLDLTQLPSWAENFGRTLGQPGTSYAKPLKICKVLIQADSRRCFDEQSTPDGIPWRPLARPRDLKKFSKQWQKRIAKQRSVRRLKDKILRDKGLLMASVTSQGAGHVERLTDTELVIGSNLNYAGIHQYGGSIHHEERRRPYPRKPWVWQTPSGQTIFSRRIKAHDVRVPARRYMGFGPRLLEKIDQVFLDFMTGQL